MREKQSGRLRYYHSSNNCCGRLLEEPSLITNRDDFDRFLARIAESDILQWAIAQRPNSDWVVELVTNVTFFINRIVHHPIGCVGIDLPDYVKRNTAIVGLEKTTTMQYTETICAYSDVWAYIWDARPQRCWTSTRTRPYATLSV